MQLDALIVAGVAQENIFVDQGSGATAARPGLAALLATVAEGDTIVAWRLDRFGRSVLNLADLLDGLRTRGVTIRSITDGVDTSSSDGAPGIRPPLTALAGQAQTRT